MSDKPEILHFKPRARLMQLLGEQLIRDHRLAVFELVKNAYDADASQVTLRFYDLAGDDPRIEIEDDGEGMTLDIVKGSWLEVASNKKERQKKQEDDAKKRTKKFRRLPIGEKGVGRFAVHKLGDHIKMVTRTADHKEVVVEIDWASFLEHEYLDKAPVKVTERTPTQFKGKKHGTQLVISKLKQEWGRGDIRRLYRTVMSIVSPFEGQSSFKVDFKLEASHKEWLQNLFDPSEVESLAMYSFDFEYDESGFHSNYQFTPLLKLQADFEGRIEPRPKPQEKGFAFQFYKSKPPTIEKGWSGRDKRIVKDGKFTEGTLAGQSPAEMLDALGIGQIKGKILAFDLDKELTARYPLEGVKEYLKEQGGMRVYRDGMRVYDYGEQGNDWLGLDERRVQTPTRKLSNNLILGEIYLDLEKSLELVEKTNREGFIENEAYTELRYAILCALVQFEAERSKDKRKVRMLFKKGSNGASPDDTSTEAAIHSLRDKVRERGLENTLGQDIEQLEKNYIKTRDVLMSAVGAGLGLSVVFHELERGVRGLHRAIEEKFDFARLKALSKQLIELLQSSAYLVKNQGKESLKASELVKYALFSTELRFNYHHINLINGFENLPDFSVKGSRRMLTATLVNLIDNAIYWVGMNRQDEHDAAYIWVGPSNDLEGPAIVVADSGAGFEDAPEDVIRPFFSRRLEGMGLGLYYADLTMKSHGGRLAFPSKSNVDVPRVCTGAKVAMVFGERGKK